MCKVAEERDTEWTHEIEVETPGTCEFPWSRTLFVPRQIVPKKAGKSNVLFWIFFLMIEIDLKLLLHVSVLLICAC